MIKIYILIGCLFLFIHSIYGQIFDSFSDGDFTFNPSWSGNNVNYEIDTSFSLHLNAPAQTDTSYLSTVSSSINNATWDFFVQMSFNPSSSNFSKIYLVSDQTNLKGPLNGYFVKIGNTSDEISLYRQDGLIETKIIDGIDDRVDTNPVNSSIRVTRDQIGNWQLFSDTLGGTNFASEGTVFDNSYTSSSFFGVFSRYTSTRSTLFFYDNFNVLAFPFIDTIAPMLDSLIIINSTQLDLYFNEPISLMSGQSLGNFSIDFGIGNPSNAVRDLMDTSLIHLSFTNPFMNAQNYTLSILNIEDTASNIIVSNSIPFNYSFIINPINGDVIINEIFADPTPQIGLPTEEFIELYNTSSNTYNLNNWTFVNSSSIKSLPNFDLFPNNYVILCDLNDTALFTPFGNVIGINSFTSLTNSGDSLTIIDNNGTVLDVVNYSINWYQDQTKDNGGWSLERINPFLPCSYSLNWIASINATGGTPANQNSVYDTLPDISAPQINSVTINTTTEISILFNEPMDSSSLANANYLFSNNIFTSTLFINNIASEVILTITPAIDSSTFYSLNIIGATDCSGNLLVLDSISFGIGKVPEKYEVVISEIYADPSPSNGLPLADYIEVFNTTPKILDLTNCWISDLTSMSQINAGKILPGESVIICDDGDETDFLPFGKVITVNNFPSLNNAEDAITLFTPDTFIIHHVNYFDSWYQDEIKMDGGWSLEIIDPKNPCGESQNWIASSHLLGGTPSTLNTANGSNIDFILPQLIEANATSDSTVLVTFNEPIDQDGFQATTYNIDQGIVIDTSITINNKQVLIHLNNKLVAQTKYTITVDGTFDCIGNLIGINNTASFALPEKNLPNDLIINEVLFNPFPGGSDFVEVYNRSNKFINLENWSLANLENDMISNHKLITDKPKLILPGEFVLLTVNANSIAQEYFNSKTTAFLQIENFPTYGNSEGTVFLINDEGLTIDFFQYKEDLHFSLLNSNEGVSLERIDYNRPTKDITNWHSASADVGFATPGFENSQYQKTINTNQNILIEPQTFSPNNDGEKDVVNISYNFSTPGFVANISIYDVKGRLIKNLVQNELLGNNGIFSWDGINQSNEKARIGIYIIYFEVFNLNGEVRSFKKTTVLASQ